MTGSRLLLGSRASLPLRQRSADANGVLVDVVVDQVFALAAEQLHVALQRADQREMPIELNGGAVADTTVAGECGELVFTTVVNREQVAVAHVIGDARVVIGAGGFVDAQPRPHEQRQGATPQTDRTEERRGGRGCVSTGRTRGEAWHL